MALIYVMALHVNGYVHGYLNGHIMIYNGYINGIPGMK